MKKIVFSIIIFAIAFANFAENSDELSAEEFIQRVQSPPGRESWAAMDGTASHLRRGRAIEKKPVYLAIRFTPERTYAQLIFNDEEGYFIGQKYSSGEESTTVIPMNKKGYDNSGLADFGLRPQDLTMTFIFWKFLDELEKDSFKGRSCRVFMLQSHRKNEKAKIYISDEYYFPLKVQWFKNKNGKTEKPYRTLEVSSFRKEDDFWVISKLIIFGPGWKSKIEFDDIKTGYSDEVELGKLYRKIDDTEN